MEPPAKQPRESTTRFRAVLGAMAIGATLVITGHATVEEASNYLTIGIAYLTAVSSTKRDPDSLG